LMEQDLLVGIQDMGAAGLTSSSTEMASRAGTGIELELANVPRREPGMTPYEVLLSESQERMLLVAKSGREGEVLDICKKWDVDAAVIGQVTNDGFLRVKEKGVVVAEVPARALTDKALAVTADCNSLYCLLNPYTGAASAVAEAARNLVCAGARPLALTDCLNFGNPERPDIMWQFILAVEGIADACKALQIPVVSGN